MKREYKQGWYKVRKIIGRKWEVTYFDGVHKYCENILVSGDYREATAFCKGRIDAMNIDSTHAEEIEGDNLNTATDITKKALSKIETLTTAELCKAYEDTNMMSGDYVPYLRDWYMYALEKRDEAAFIAWMETEDIELMDKPSVFFI